MKHAIHRFFNQVWYGERSFWPVLLLPLAGLVKAFTARKRHGYLNGSKPAARLPVPVIVVGNITVGGTGKTPLVVWLVQQLQQHGYRPGIVSRGYGSKAPHYPYLIKPADAAAVVGDEPLMLARRTGVPVMIDPRRPQAAQALLDQTDCDVIVSDDGLQHYALARCYEIVVLDGRRGLGNGCLLPAGPLRESADRLRTLNAIVVNGQSVHPSLHDRHLPSCYRMDIVPQAFTAITTNATADAADIRQQAGWTAVAGIGNPQRFFDTLEQLGIRFAPAAFPDHHAYSAPDFADVPPGTVLTTEKDAVKLQALGIEGWYLAVEARLQPGLIDDILAALSRFKSQPHYRY